MLILEAIATELADKTGIKKNEILISTNETSGFQVIGSEFAKMRKKYDGILTIIELHKLKKLPLLEIFLFRIIRDMSLDLVPEIGTDGDSEDLFVTVTITIDDIVEESRLVAVDPENKPNKKYIIKLDDQEYIHRLLPPRTNGI